MSFDTVCIHLEVFLQISRNYAVANRVKKNETTTGGFFTLKLKP